MKKDWQSKDNVYCYEGLNRANIIKGRIASHGLSDLGKDELGFLPVTGYDLAVIQWALLEFERICYEDEEISKRINEGLKDVLGALYKKIKEEGNAFELNAKEYADRYVSRVRAREAFQREAKEIYDRYEEDLI